MNCFPQCVRSPEAWHWCSSCCFKSERLLAPRTKSLLFTHWKQLFQTYDTFSSALQQSRSHSAQPKKPSGPDEWHTTLLVGCAEDSQLLASTPQSTNLVLNIVRQHRYLSTNSKHKCIFYQQSTALPCCSSTWQACLCDYYHCRKAVRLVLTTCLSEKPFPSLTLPDPRHSSHLAQKNTSQTVALPLCVFAHKSYFSLVETSSWDLLRATEPFSVTDQTNMHVLMKRYRRPKWESWYRASEVVSLCQEESQEKWPAPGHTLVKKVVCWLACISWELS